MCVYCLGSHELSRGGYHSTLDVLNIVLYGKLVKKDHKNFVGNDNGFQTVLKTYI